MKTSSNQLCFIAMLNKYGFFIGSWHSAWNSKNDKISELIGTFHFKSVNLRIHAVQRLNVADVIYTLNGSVNWHEIVQGKKLNWNKIDDESDRWLYVNFVNFSSMFSNCIT